MPALCAHLTMGGRHLQNLDSRPTSIFIRFENMPTASFTYVKSQADGEGQTSRNYVAPGKTICFAIDVYTEVAGLCEGNIVVSREEGG